MKYQKSMKKIEVRRGRVNRVISFAPAREVIGRRVYDTEKSATVASYVTDYIYEGQRFYYCVMTVYKKRNGERFVYRHDAWRGKHVFTEKEFPLLNVCNSDGSGFPRVLRSIEELEGEYSPLRTY